MATETNALPTHVGGQLEVIESPIANLADEDLAAIFKRLPPYERLTVSVVCSKWRDINQAPWRDVSRLDLRNVPSANIRAVIKKCPNLTSVLARPQALGNLGGFVSRLSNVTSLKCVRCTFTHNKPAVRCTFTRNREIARSVPAGASLRSVACQELVWHNSKSLLMDSGVPLRAYSLPHGNPYTLRRLQISALDVSEEDRYDIGDAMRLPLLECFILADVTVNYPRLRSRGCLDILIVLQTLKKLREVYLDSPHSYHLEHHLCALPELQILYLDNVDYDFERTNLEGLITRHPSLCVLVITASRTNQFNGEITIPVRKLFPNGFNAPPVPQLHLFLGKIVAEKLRFHRSPTDALKIYPINAPLPEFLAKDEIKPMFEGSWIASRIKDGAKEGVNLANYSFEGNAELISFVQE